MLSFIKIFPNRDSSSPASANPGPALKPLRARSLSQVKFSLYLGFYFLIIHSRYFNSNPMVSEVPIEYNSPYKRVDLIMTNVTGIVALLGSGETSAAGGLVFEAVARRLADRPQIGILETPAGFELNTHRVAGRVAEYLNVRLQNFQPPGPADSSAQEKHSLQYGRCRHLRPHLIQ